MSDAVTERDERILRAAITVFSRFGVSKATMSDVASEAGVARQTVYNAFPGKPELLRASARLAVMESQADIRTAWAKAESIDTKIDIFYEKGPLLWFDMMQASPAMVEVFDGVNEHAKLEVAEGAKAWVKMLEETFAEDGLRSKAPGVSLADLGEFFYFASVNAKYSAESREVLEARLRTIKAALLNLLS